MKTFKTFLLLLCILPGVIHIQHRETSAYFGENDGEIVELKDYVFPAYQKAVETTDVERYSSQREYELALKDQKFKFQKITYLSDNLKVIAYLYAPVERSDKKYPVIIFNRGSFIRSDIAPELISTFYRMASQGFVILAPMYRQSDGSDGRDYMGGEDVNDLMNTVPLAKNLKFIDINNLFMLGESRGGMMTYQAIKKDFPINAAAVFGAFTDLEEMTKSRPDIYTLQLAKTIWGDDFETKKEEIFRTRSAVYWADKIDVPVLIMHGGNDSSVSPIQSLRLAQKLLELNKVFELIVYAGDNHILSANKDDKDERAIRWFKKHLNR